MGREVPQDLSGVFYNKGLTILLMIVTLGIWGVFWTYRTSEDLKKYNGDGLGGVLAVVIYLLLSVVLMFRSRTKSKKCTSATAGRRRGRRSGGCGSCRRSLAT